VVPTAIAIPAPIVTAVEATIPVPPAVMVAVATAAIEVATPVVPVPVIATAIRVAIPGVIPAIVVPVGPLAIAMVDRNDHALRGSNDPRVIRVRGHRGPEHADAYDGGRRKHRQSRPRSRSFEHNGSPHCELGVAPRGRQLLAEEISGVSQCDRQTDRIVPVESHE
jgi:hypothetical protein